MVEVRIYPAGKTFCVAMKTYCKRQTHMTHCCIVCYAISPSYIYSRPHTTTVLFIHVYKSVAWAIFYANRMFLHFKHEYPEQMYTKIAFRQFQNVQFTDLRLS